MESGKVFLGVLAGMATGAILGILFAPAKGSVTRKGISDKGEEYANSFKEKYHELLDTVSKKYGSTKNEVEDLVSKGKSKFKGMKNEFEKESVS